jgi:hypothetical protein
LIGAKDVGSSKMGTVDPQDCFVLKWSDFSSSVVSNLQEMRHDTDFCDVTLSCDEQSFIQGSML